MQDSYDRPNNRKFNVGCFCDLLVDYWPVEPLCEPDLGERQLDTRRESVHEDPPPVGVSPMDEVSCVKCCTFYILQVTYSEHRL